MLCCIYVNLILIDELVTNIRRVCCCQSHIEEFEVLFLSGAINVNIDYFIEFGWPDVSHWLSLCLATAMRRAKDLKICSVDPSTNSHNHDGLSRLRRCLFFVRTSFTFHIAFFSLLSFSENIYFFREPFPTFDIHPRYRHFNV